jgi:HK97 family phage major capsid protein
MNLQEIKSMRENRAKAHADAIAALRDNNKQAYERAMSACDDLGNKIQVAEAARSGVAPRDYARENSVWQNPQEHLRHASFMKYLRHGKEGLESSDRILLERRDVAEGAPMLTHVGTYTGLGFFVPTGFANQIEEATKYFCPFLSNDVCQMLDTATGNPIPYPTNNDTSNVATIVGEASSVGEEDVTAAQITFAAYKLTSGLVKLSMELLQDSAFDLEAWLSRKFGERYGRGLESLFTNGTGSSQPTGVLTAILASGSTPVVAQGSSESTGGAQTGANSIGYSDLVNLEHSVDPTYRRGAKYMFHDQTLSAIKRIIDKYGRPLWAPGISVGEPDTINGYSYVINQSMPQIGSETNTVIFGDFSKFIIRRVKDLSIQRLNELYAVNGQVGFLSFARVDSNLVDAGTHPLNILQQHS